MNKKLSFIHDNREVHYTIEKSRRTSISISVSIKNGARVKIPLNSPYEKAINFVESKKSWIIKHLDRLSKRAEQSPKLKYIDNDDLLFLGERYQLKVVLSNKDEQVKIDGRYIIVECRDPSRVKPIVKIWYYNKAIEIIVPIFNRMAEQFREDNKKYPRSLAFKYVRSYWGICSRDQDIRFNVELIRMSPSLIEYIVAHELCHLCQMNHSPLFYALVEKYIPDYKKKIKEIKDNYAIVM